MSYLRCNYLEHENSEIKYICIDNNCNRQRCACFGCKFEFHKNHNLKELDQFKSFVREKNESRNKLREYLNSILKQMNALDYCLNRIKLTHESDVESLSLTELSNQVQCLLIYASMEKVILKKLEEVWPKSKQMEKQLEDLLNLLIENEAIELKAKTQKNLLHQNSERSIQTASQSRKSLRQTTEILTTSSEIPLLFRSTLSKLNKTQFIELKEPKSLQIKFTNTIYSNSGIQILSSKQAAGIGYVFCQPSLQENQFVQFGFKLSAGYDIGIGVCSKTIFFTQFCKPNLSKTGHGLYLLNGKGQVYSHEDEFINNKALQIIFRQGELIIFQVNLIDMYIRWLNQQREEIYRMNIQLLDSMHVILNLLGTVEIVDL